MSRKVQAIEKKLAQAEKRLGELVKEKTKVFNERGQVEREVALKVIAGENGDALSRKLHDLVSRLDVYSSAIDQLSDDMDGLRIERAAAQREEEAAKIAAVFEEARDHLKQMAVQVERLAALEAEIEGKIAAALHAADMADLHELQARGRMLKQLWHWGQLPGLWKVLSERRSFTDRNAVQALEEGDFSRGVRHVN